MSVLPVAQVCEALQRGVLYVNMHDLSLHAADKCTAEERLLHQQLQLAGQLLPGSSFAGALSQCVAMRMQAASFPGLQEHAVQAWLNGGALQTHAVGTDLELPSCMHDVH